MGGEKGMLVLSRKGGPCMMATVQVKNKLRRNDPWYMPIHAIEYPINVRIMFKI